jgi:molybdenum cofactor biosynthesis enzyme MoaA
MCLCFAVSGDDAALVGVMELVQDMNMKNFSVVLNLILCQQSHVQISKGQKLLKHHKIILRTLGLLQKQKSRRSNWQHHLPHREIEPMNIY